MSRLLVYTRSTSWASGEGCHHNLCDSGAPSVWGTKHVNRGDECSTFEIDWKFVVCLVSALGYGVDGRVVRVPAGDGNFSLHHRVQNGSGTHQASYRMNTEGSFPGINRSGRGADHSPPSNAEVKEW